MQTFYTKLADEAYFSLPFLSQSNLKNLVSNSYAEYLSIVKENAVIEPSDEMRIGTIMHSLNLENANLEAIKTFKRLDGRTTDGKLQKKEISGLRSYLFEDEIEKIKTMSDLYKASFPAQALMSKSNHIEEYGVAEIFNEPNPDNKIHMKFKPDLVGDDFIADYKTHSGYNTDENLRSILKKRDYPFQAASYLILDSIITGTMKQNFYFIFQQTIEPYGVRVVRLENFLIDLAVDRFDKAIKKFIQAINEPEKYTNPNYTEVNDIGLSYY